MGLGIGTDDDNCMCVVWFGGASCGALSVGVCAEDRRKGERAAKQNQKGDPNQVLNATLKAVNSRVASVLFTLLWWFGWFWFYNSDDGPNARIPPDSSPRNSIPHTNKGEEEF